MILCFGSCRTFRSLRVMMNTLSYLCHFLLNSLFPYDWASGQVVRALDCCAKRRWFEPNHRIIVGILAHCPPSSKWVPGGTTGEAKGGEERNWPPYLTMPAAQDKCPSNGHSPNVRNHTWDSPFISICPAVLIPCHTDLNYFDDYFLMLLEKDRLIGMN